MGILNNNKFEKGMIAGAQPFEDKFKETSEKLDDVFVKMDSFITDQTSITNTILTELSNKEKQELFDLNFNDKLIDLDLETKEFMLGILYTLSKLIGNTSDFQKNYILNLQQFFSIQEPQLAISLESISNIEDLSIYRLLYKLVNEFVYLYEGNFHDYELEEILYDHFSLSKKEKEGIREGIEIIVSVVGMNGLSELYKIEQLSEEEDLDNEDDIDINLHLKSKREEVLKILSEMDLYGFKCIPYLSQSKINKIHKHFSNTKNSEIIGYKDGSVTGSFKAGYVFFEDKISFKEHFDESKDLYYKDIDELELIDKSVYIVSDSVVKEISTIEKEYTENLYKALTKIIALYKNEK